MSEEFKEHSAPESETTTASSETDGSNKELSPAEAPPYTTEAPVADSAYSSSSGPYGAQPELIETGKTTSNSELAPPAALAPAPPKEPPPPPPPPPEDDEGDEEEKGMLRMSFMEHLEELRARILRALAGIVVAFLLSITFCKALWGVVSAPAVQALKNVGINPPHLVAITPMEQFNVIYLKLPLLVSIFLGSPWILYQVWAFISPGLYKREKKWAVPFILCTAGLFITGGCFAYFVAFRYGLEFLLGIGRDINVSPFVSIDAYFNLFVNVTLGVGLVFEMPVLIFFLTLLRLASPRFLIRHSRYAILGITILAAIVTPTPDVFNMMIFAVPMVALFFVGVLASYLLVLKREKRKFPWGPVLLVTAGIILLIAATWALLIYVFHFHFIPKWPYVVK